MSLNESIVEDAALEWFLLRRLLRQGYEGQEGYGGQVGEQSRFARTLTPAISHGERENSEAIRRLNPASPLGRAGNRQGILVSSKHIERKLTP